MHFGSARTVGTVRPGTAIGVIVLHDSALRLQLFPLPRRAPRVHCNSNCIFGQVMLSGRLVRVLGQRNVHGLRALPNYPRKETQSRQKRCPHGTRQAVRRADLRAALAAQTAPPPNSLRVRGLGKATNVRTPDYSYRASADAAVYCDTACATHERRKGCAVMIRTQRAHPHPNYVRCPTPPNHPRP